MIKPPEMGTIEILDPQVVCALRDKTPAERVEMAFASNRLVRERLHAHLSYEHPDWTETQLLDAVAKRMLYGTS